MKTTIRFRGFRRQNDVSAEVGLLCNKGMESNRYAIILTYGDHQVRRPGVNRQYHRDD